jgi:hypothetical protein
VILGVLLRYCKCGQDGWLKNWTERREKITEDIRREGENGRVTTPFYSHSSHHLELICHHPADSTIVYNVLKQVIQHVDKQQEVGRQKTKSTRVEVRRNRIWVVCPGAEMNERGRLLLNKIKRQEADICSQLEGKVVVQLIEDHQQ